MYARAASRGDAPSIIVTSVTVPSDTRAMVHIIDMHQLTKDPGMAGQAGAIRHGISRALLEADETLRRKEDKREKRSRSARWG